MYYTKRNHCLEKPTQVRYRKLFKEFSEKYNILALWLYNLFFEENDDINIRNLKLNNKDITQIKKSFLKLPLRFQYILLNRRFSISPLSKLDDIGEELNISKQRVKQIENEALAFLADSILEYRLVRKHKKEIVWKQIIHHSEGKFAQKAGAVNARRANY